MRRARRCSATSRRPAADLRQLLRAATRRAASTSTARASHSARRISTSCASSPSSSTRMSSAPSGTAAASTSTSRCSTRSSATSSSTRSTASISSSRTSTAARRISAAPTPTTVRRRSPAPARIAPACARRASRSKPSSGRSRDINGSLGVTYADTKYRHNLVGTNGNALIQRAVPASRTADFQRAEMDGDRFAGLDSADRRQRHARPVLRRCPPHDRASTPGPTSISRRSQNGYTVVNGRVGVRGPDDRWSVEVWAQNLFDEKYKQVAFDAPLQGSGTQRGRCERGFYTAVDAAVRRVPRRAADLRRDLARQARLPAAAPAPAAAGAAAAAAAGDADLPRRFDDRGRRRLPARLRRRHRRRPAARAEQAASAAILSGALARSGVGGCASRAERSASASSAVELLAVAAVR